MPVETTEADLRRRWAAGQPCHGVWSLLPGAVTAEVLAGTGADFVVTDLQHGAVTEGDLPGVAAAIRAAGSVPLVRTRSPLFPDIGRPLDLGAAGVIVPNVRDADHARQVVAATRYAPAGGRSIGRLSGRADHPLVVVMVETATALDDLDAVLAVEGLDGVYVGPGDLSLSLGLDGTDRSAELREVLSGIVARAVAAGVPVGVHAYGGADAAGFADEGASIVTVAVDTVSLRDTVANHLDVARGRPEPAADADAARSVRHCVLVRVPAEEQDEWVDVMTALRALVAELPGALSFDAGPNVSPEAGMDKGYSQGFSIDFADAGARDGYLSDPRHEALGKRILRLAAGDAEGVLVFDLAVPG